MPRRALAILSFLAVLTPAGGQVKGILGFPDRVMSSSRIGMVSQRNIPGIPPADTSRMIFPEGGERWVSEDYDFFNYLRDNDLRQDARTLAAGAYAPSDTLDFLRAEVLFSDLRLTQASEFFGKVPASSVFGPESFFYRVVSLTSLGDYEGAAGLIGSAPARFTSDGPYAELSALQSAGLALLRGDEEDWRRSSAAFTFSDFKLADSEQVLTEIAENRLNRRGKSPALAALASAVVPGAGKVYSGRLGEGVAAFLTVGSLGAVTAENWCRHGVKDWRTIVSGSLCSVFYLGNIYGSYMTVSIERDERIKAENAAVVYHLHLPLRAVFR